MRSLAFAYLLLTAAQVFAQADTSAWYARQTRRIHMDFHTPDVRPDRVIKRFDPEAYAKTLDDAHVNSLVTFAKGHHGYSYYDTELGTKHPGLPDSTDMLGEITAACHARDIAVAAYYSVGWLTTVEKEHPEWMERDSLGRKVGTSGVEKTDGWNLISLHSPYLEEVVLPELREIAGGYDVDGVWIDIVENQPDYSGYALEAYAKTHDGATYPNHAAAVAFADETRRRAVAAMRAAVREVAPGKSFTFNTAGRDPRVSGLVDYHSIETHPGATWHQGAWTHALLTMKYLRRAGKPFESTTSRFLHGWGGWDDQPVANMLAVASRIVANGGAVNLGDQTYPDGTLDTALYERIGEVFDTVRRRERWGSGGEAYPEAAVLAAPFDIYAIYGQDPAQLDAYLGAAKALSAHHWAFSLVSEEDEGLAEALATYPVVVVPKPNDLSAATISLLEAYVRDGGRVLLTESAPATAMPPALASLLGVYDAGASAYSTGYLALDAAVSEGVRRSPLLVPAPFRRVAPDRARTLATLVEPLIEPRPEELFLFRHGELSPPGDSSDYAAVTYHRVGRGEVIYVAAPIFEAYLTQHQWYLGDVADRLLASFDAPRAVRVEAPRSVEVTLTEKDGHLVVHLVNYHLGAERNFAEEVVPVDDIELVLDTQRLHTAGIRVIGADPAFTLAPDGPHARLRLGRIDTYTQVAIPLRTP